MYLLLLNVHQVENVSTETRRWQAASHQLPPAVCFSLIIQIFSSFAASLPPINIFLREFPYCIVEHIPDAEESDATSPAPGTNLPVFPWFMWNRREDSTRQQVVFSPFPPCSGAGRSFLHWRRAMMTKWIVDYVVPHPGGGNGIPSKNKRNGPSHPASGFECTGICIA